MDTSEHIQNKPCVHNEKGATMVEYALLVALMAIGCITVTSLMSYRIGQKFEAVAVALGGGNTPLF